MKPKIPIEKQISYSTTITFRLSEYMKDEFLKLSQAYNLEPSKFSSGQLLRLFIHAYIDNPQKYNTMFDTFIREQRENDGYNEANPDTAFK